MHTLRWLLWFLPGEFRREYGPELLITAADQWRALRRSAGLATRLRFWPRQWVATIRIGVGMWRGKDPVGGRRRPPRRRSWLPGLGKDVRHALRGLTTSPVFTGIAVLTLALGVGATTAMFSAVHAVLLRDFSYRQPDEIVVVRQTTGVGSVEDGVSAANLRDLATSTQTLSYVAGAEAHGLRLIEEDRAFSLRSWLVSEGFFEAIGTDVQIGRTFLAHEFVSGGERVVLLSHETWQTRFGGDPDIVGRELFLDGALHAVVGVLEPGFKYPSAAELWGPRPPQPGDVQRRNRVTMDGIARLAPGVTLGEAQAELDAIAETLAVLQVDANTGFRIIPLRTHLVGDVRPALVLLLGVVGLVLAIAAANVAGLQLARGAGRAREYALRGALGASAPRILRLVTIENLLLAGCGGALGVGLASFGVDLIRVAAPDYLPRIEEIRIDGNVLGFALLITLGSALVAGLAPALRAARSDPRAALADGTRGTTGGSGASTIRDRLVVTEIAVALVLAIGAGLLVRSFDKLLDTELGFDPEHKLAVQVWAYDDQHGAQLDFFARGIQALVEVPGVERVGLTTSLPLADDRSLLSRSSTVRFTLDDRAAPPPGNEPSAGLAAIDSGYTSAMGIPLIAGRTFSANDQPRSPRVVMVNQAFVRRHFPDREAVGQRLTLDWRTGGSREIVGVLADVRREGFASTPQPELYVPLSQEPTNGLTFVVRTTAAAASLTTEVQEALWTADPRQAIWAARSLPDLAGDWTRQRRFNTVLFVVFATLALSLAAIGVYGLVSFTVQQRIPELGIRRALGGQANEILVAVLGRGLTLTLLGVGLGLGGALVVTRLLRSMLFGVEPADPLTFVSLSLLVVLVAGVAAWLPARRATRIDPMVALRAE